MNRKLIFGFTFIIFLAGILFVRRHWQKIHNQEPIAAFYALAYIMEQGNKNELERIAPRGTAAEIDKLSKPYGGIRHLGKLLRGSSEVSASVHVPFTSIEVIAEIEGKRLVLLFLKKKGGDVTTSAFFVS